MSGTEGDQEVTLNAESSETTYIVGGVQGDSTNLQSGDAPKAEGQNHGQSEVEVPTEQSSLAKDEQDAKCGNRAEEKSQETHALEEPEEDTGCSAEHSIETEEVTDELLPQTSEGIPPYDPSAAAASTSLGSALGTEAPDGVAAGNASASGALATSDSFRVPAMLMLSSMATPCPIHSFQPGHCNVFFCCSRHGRWPSAGTSGEIASKWRQKERLKTSSVALVVCLNIGVDPPDVIKISPCARLECWVDPLAMPSKKALDTIGKNLQAQYERWQPRAKYKAHLDPTTDDMKKLCTAARRNAKGERMLFHYNGHGVPRPTVNGEIWVFNKDYTQYIPLSVYDLQAWVGTPAIYVFDCSSAGLIVNTFKVLLEQRMVQQLPPGHSGRARGGSAHGPVGWGSHHGGDHGDGSASREVILLAACAATELLPQSPELPADVFTACLTTPIKVALRWFCSRSLLKNEGLTKDQIDRIPGKQTDRKTLLGELNWIFTAITDTIAWNVLPRALFQKLFRQDLLVASLFRNFLLAERIMRAANCNPVSYPQMPPTHQHPMWQAWDLAAERCLAQLPDLLNGDPNAEFQPSPFFSEQLTAFEIWLHHGSKDKQPPEQLPIVLQVLLSQVHRMRALILLGRFLDMGPWAVDLALSVGIFPYVLKLLQTTATDLRQILVFIWTKILALDKSCQVDLVKDNGHMYFIKFLESSDMAITDSSRAMAAFVLAVICDGHHKGQICCASNGLLSACISRLPVASDAPAAAARSPALIKWVLLCLAKQCENMADIAAAATRENAPAMIANLLGVEDPEIRAAAVYALGSLVTVPSQLGQGGGGGHEIHEGERYAAEREIICYLIQMIYDGSSLVRAEVAVALARVAAGHSLMMEDALMVQIRSSTRRSQEVKSVGGSSWDDRHGSHTSDQGSDQGAAEGAEANLGGRQATRSAKASFDYTGLEQSNSPDTPTSSFPGIFVLSRGIVQPPAVKGYDGPSRGPAPTGGEGTRSGSGIYEHLCQAMFLLATDPSPTVARLGRSALTVCNVELVAVLPKQPMASEHSGSMHGGSAAAGAMGMIRRSIGLPTNQGSVGSAPADRPPQYAQPPTCQKRYVLRKIRAHSQSHPELAAQRDSHGASHMPPRAESFAGHGEDPHCQYHHHHHQQRQQPHSQSSPSLPTAGLEQAGVLPPSVIFPLLSEALRSPLLDHGRGDIANGDVEIPAMVIGHGGSLHQTIHDSQLRRFMRVGHEGTPPGLRLKDNLVAVETDSDVGTAAVHFSPFDSLLTSVDHNGVLRTYNLRRLGGSARPVSRFHLASGDPVPAQGAPAEAPGPGVSADYGFPTEVCYTFLLNELHGSGVLGACAADGTVRLWRGFTAQGQQELAAAWQAVPRPGVLDHSGGSSKPAVFHHGAAGGHLLFASGGVRPRCISVWDLNREICVDQLTVEPLGTSGTRLYVQAVAGNPEEPLLAAGCSRGGARVFDLRAPYQQPAIAVSAVTASEASFGGGTSLAGLALRPETLAGSSRLVAACANGMLKFWDLRATSQPLRTVQASTSPTSGLSVLAAHPNAPLLATGSRTQMVKVWGASGEQLGGMRPVGSSFLGAAKSGGSAINCLQFQPYGLRLAAGSDSHVVALFSIENTAKPEAP